MIQNLAENKFQSHRNYEETVPLMIGQMEFPITILILCPNQSSDDSPHYLKRNGHDTHNSQRNIQYRCVTCNRSFYAHTSRWFTNLAPQIRSEIFSLVQQGKFNITMLSQTLHQNKSVISKLVQKILEIMATDYREKEAQLTPKIKGQTIIVDETFLKIYGIVWYIVGIISPTGDILDLQLVPTRIFDILFPMIQRAIAQLEGPLKIMATDGFQEYIGIAKALNQDLTHIRHIHKPPYGRVEITTYHYTTTNLEIVHGYTQNDIFVLGGPFLVQIEEKKEPLPGPKKIGRKKGSKNRSKSEIEAEKKRKSERKGKLGRPKGTKKQHKNSRSAVFHHNAKTHDVRAYDPIDEAFAVALSDIAKVFPNQHITTNRIEGYWSVIKQLLNFRGRRTVECWKQLLLGYRIARQDPDFLKACLEKVEISIGFIHRALPTIISLKRMEGIPSSVK